MGACYGDGNGAVRSGQIYGRDVEIIKARDITRALEGRSVVGVSA